MIKIFPKATTPFPIITQTMLDPIIILKHTPTITIRQFIEIYVNRKLLLVLWDRYRGYNLRAK